MTSIHQSLEANIYDFILISFGKYLRIKYTKTNRVMSQQYDEYTYEET